MAILNFPNTRLDGSPLQSGDQYTGDNGVTYIFDGVKWVGRAVAQPAGTNSITNNGNTLQIDPTGNLIIPTGAFIYYESGQPLAGAQGPQGERGIQGERGLQGPKGDKGDQGVPGSTGAQGDPGPQGDPGATGAQGVSVTLKGTKALIADLPDVGQSAGDAWIVTESNGGDLYFWNSSASTWDNIGKIVGPQGDRGPQGVPGSRGAQGDQGPPGNDGATGPQGNPGEQGNPGPAGIGVLTGGTTGQFLVKASDNDYDTEWASSSNTTDRLTAGSLNLIFNSDGALTFPAGSTQYDLGAGDSILSHNIEVHSNIWAFNYSGSLTLPNGSTIGDGESWAGVPITTTRGTILLGNEAECAGGESHFHIMKAGQQEIDLFLGDDNNYVKLPSTGGVEVSSNSIGTQHTWTFDTDGKLTLPAGGVITGPVSPPLTITLDNADWTPANYTYTRDFTVIATPTWTSGSTDSYVIYNADAYQWEVRNPAFGTNPIYLNGGSLTFPTREWTVGPTLGTVAPTGVYSYVNEYNFEPSTLTIPGTINAIAGNDLNIRAFNPVGGGVTISLQNRNLDTGGRTTQFEVAPDIIRLTTEFDTAQKTWTFGAEDLTATLAGTLTTPNLWRIGNLDNQTTIGNTGYGNPNDLLLTANSAVFIVSDLETLTEYQSQWMFSGKNIQLPNDGDIVRWNGSAMVSVLGAGGNTFDQSLNTTDNVAFAKVNFGQQSSKLNPPEPNGSTDLLTLWDFEGGNPVGEYYNYAIGVEGDHVWFAQDTDPTTTDGGFKFYSRGQQVFKVAANGTLIFKDGGQQTTAFTGTGNFTFDGDQITNNNYSQIKSETGVELNVNYDNIIGVSQNTVYLQNNNPNFSPTYGTAFGSYIAAGESFGFGELLNTDYVGPSLLVATLVEHHGQDAETISMWTVDKNGNLVTVKATVWENNVNGAGSEISTGDIIDKDGNSLIYVPASDTAPAHNLDGLLWYNSDEGRMYIKYMGTWVDASPTVIPPPVEPRQLINGENTVTIDNNGFLEFSSGGAVGNVQQTLSPSANTNLPGIDLYATPDMAWAQLNYDNKNYVWVDDKAAYFDVEFARLKLDADGVLKLNNMFGARMIMGEIRDGDAVLWVDPGPDTEYLGLWWAGNTNYDQTGQTSYGPDAGINIGIDGWDDTNGDVDPDTQINLGIGSLRWKFAADGSLTIPGNGWASETPDIGTDDSSLFISARGDSLRTVWWNTAPFQTLGSTDATWLRTELRQEGFNVNIGQKDGEAITPRNWQFRADGVINLPAGVGDIMRDGVSVLGNPAVVDGGAADTWLTPV